MRASLHFNARGLHGIPRWGRFLFACSGLLLATGCGTLFQSDAQQQAQEDTRFSRALAHYAEGLLLETDRSRTADVQRAFVAACQLDPDSRHPVDALILHQLQNGHTREALNQLESFCRNHPGDLDAHCDLARVAEVNEDFARAATYYDLAYRMQPDNSALALSLIRTLFAERHDEDAIAVMRSLNHSHPSVDTRNLPIFWAIQFYRRTPTPERALPCLDLANETATGITQRVELRLFYGEVALAAGRTNEAVHAFRQVLEHKPMHIHAILNLAHVLRQRDGQMAIAEQMQRVQDHPDDSSALLTLAAIHLAGNDRTNAAPVLARAHDNLLAHKMVPTVEIDLLHGATLDELGRTNEALAVFQEALQRHPHADVLLNYLAYMLSVSNTRLDEAANWSKESLKIRPNNGAYLDTLGWIRYRQQRYEEALDLLLQARDRLPDDPTVLDHLGDVLAALHRIPEAAAYWSRSFAIAPEQPLVAEKLRSAGVDPASIRRIEPQPVPPVTEDLDDVDEE